MYGYIFQRISECPVCKKRIYSQTIKPMYFTEEDFENSDEESDDVSSGGNARNTATSSRRLVPALLPINMNVGSKTNTSVDSNDKSDSNDQKTATPNGAASAAAMNGRFWLFSSYFWTYLFFLHYYIKLHDMDEKDKENIGPNSMDISTVEENGNLNTSNERQSGLVMDVATPNNGKYNCISCFSC